MSAAFTVNCEGEADKLIAEVVRLVTQEINTTVTVTIPTSWWCSYLVNAIADQVPTRQDDETFVDVVFNVANASEADYINKLENMSDEDIQQMMDDFLEDLEEDSDEDDTDND
jgi:hypothetical protein